MRDKMKELLKKPWVAYTVAACTAVILYMLLSNISLLPVFFGYISPVLWGILIAYIINPLVVWLETGLLCRIKKDNSRHIISVVASLLVVLLLIVLLFVAFIPPLAKSIYSIVNNIDSYGKNLQSYLDNISHMASQLRIDVSKLTTAGEEFIQGMVSFVTDNSDSIVQSFFNVGTSIANVVIGIVLAIYILLDRKNLVGGINRMRKLILSEKSYERNNTFWKKCHTILSRFLVYDILDGLIIGVINMIFMLIFRMPNAILISVIVGVTNLIPTFGPIIGAILGGLLLILINPISALLFVIFSIILQIFDGSFLKPKMFGDSFGVPAVWILIAIVLGGKFFGVIGILLAIPFAAIFTYALNEIIIPILERRREGMD